MMVSMQPAPPGSGTSLDNPITSSTASSPLPLSSGTATPEPLSYPAMPLFSFDILPPAVDPSILPSPTVANYLAAARLRLLPELPNSFHGYSVSNSMWSWWCRACGALPESWTRTERGSSGSGSRTPKRNKRKRKLGTGGAGNTGAEGTEPCAATGAKRTADGDVKPGHIDEIEAQLVRIESELQRTISALSVPSTPSSPSLAPARKPPSALHRRRKPTTCANCGLSTSLRPWTTIDLPPARTVARTRSQTIEVSHNDTSEISGAPTPSGLSSVSTSEAATPEPPSSVSTPDSSAPQWFPGRVQHVFPTPSLQRISTSPGDLPTYPRPPVVPPPAPAGTSPPITIPPSGGQLPPAKKRKKKSGLAKLLAQNAQREAEGTGPGNWGLG